MLGLIDNVEGIRKYIIMPEENINQQLIFKKMMKQNII